MEYTKIVSPSPTVVLRVCPSSEWSLKWTCQTSHETHQLIAFKYTHTLASLNVVYNNKQLCAGRNTGTHGDTLRCADTAFLTP